MTNKSSPPSFHIWRLKRGSEKKFKQGHPWVFSSELAQSPKGIAAGDLIELQDDRGQFLAFGYGHPQSQISFRTLSTRADVQPDQQFFDDRLRQAQNLRVRTGVHRASHRLVFAEADFLPGLIIDRYRLQSPEAAQVFVVQASTAGIDRLLPQILNAIENLVAFENGDFNRTSIVIANDSKSRLIEGLSAEPKKIVRQGALTNPEHATILIESASSTVFYSSAQLAHMSAATDDLAMTVDFINGQKTGFFLDQRSNIQLAMRSFDGLIEEAKSLSASKPPKVLRVLDLFCYVGQWGAQLARAAADHGIECEVTLVDASAGALQIAAENVERQDAGRGLVRAVPIKLDILDHLAQLQAEPFDVVICDPPAFVKKKKDLPAGSAAYFKLNREALKRVRAGGLFVSCSCSGLFDEAEFRAMLSRLTAQNRHAMRWTARGSHSPDHPQRPEFPQGTYLKSWIGWVDSAATR